MAKRARRGTEEVTALAVVPKNRRIKILRDSATDGLISELAKRVVGGKLGIMELARLAPEVDPSLAIIIEDWDRLKKTGKQCASIDQMCKMRKVDVFHFLGVVCEVALKFRDNAGPLIAAMSMPQVIERSVKNALTKDGFKDREALMKHAGFLPVPAGATFVNTLQTRVETNVEQPNSKSLPSFEETMDI